MEHKRIKQSFKEFFGFEPDILINAPGRINLLGEHTDYNSGFVLPAAINKSMSFAFKKRNDNLLNFYASDLKESFNTNLQNIEKSKIDWANFLLGVLNEVERPLDSGFDIAFGGNIPFGGGMSSSAALESGFGYGLSLLFGLNLSKFEIVKMSQNAEHHFAGVNCGIMDMYASVFGKKDHVLKLDCETNTHEYFPLHLGSYKLILCNTGVKHNLSETAYNQRRIECHEGLKIIQKHLPNVKSLRDVSSNQVVTLKPHFTETVFKRILYVSQENERVQLACEFLNDNEIAKFGALMYETHAGLSNLYEVSCIELDFLVDQTRGNSKILGSRMMGGGFGGCTINIVHESHLDNFVSEISKNYKDQFGIELLTYIVSLENGVQQIQDL